MKQISVVFLKKGLTVGERMLYYVCVRVCIDEIGRTEEEGVGGSGRISSDRRGVKQTPVRRFNRGI